MRATVSGGTIKARSSVLALFPAPVLRGCGRGGTDPKDRVRAGEGTHRTWGAYRRHGGSPENSVLVGMRDRPVLAVWFERRRGCPDPVDPVPF